MNRTLLTAIVAFGGLVATGTAQAQDSVDIYMKPLKGPTLKSKVIASESIKGIKITDKDQLIPAEDIEDVDYSSLISPTLESRKQYGEAAILEKGAAKLTGDKRADEYTKALAKYDEAIKSLPKDLLYPRRHAEYKLGFLNAQLGFMGKQTNRQDAIKLLTEFKNKYANSWQYTSAQLLLIKLYAEQNDFDQVRTVVKELSAQPDLAAKVKLDAKLLLARMIMEIGDALIEKKSVDEGKKKYAEAKKDLQAMLAELPKDSAGHLHAILFLAQCKSVVGGKEEKKEAIDDLEKLVKTTKEKELLAAVHNELGELHYKEGRLQEALWPFLWVDVIYNQDKEQQARAEYWLWKIFNQLSEPERGQEFFESLTSNRFAGTYYQQKALKENKES